MSTSNGMYLIHDYLNIVWFVEVVQETDKSHLVRKTWRGATQVRRVMKSSLGKTIFHELNDARLALIKREDDAMQSHLRAAVVHENRKTEAEQLQEGNVLK